MKKLLILILCLVANFTFAQTIKLEGYFGSPIRFCPTGEVILEYSARDLWNNKMAGDFKFTIYVDGVNDDDVRIDLMDGSGLPPMSTPTFSLSVNSNNNKEVIFKVVHRVTDQFGNVTWVNGFGEQTGDVRIKASFKHHLPFSSWKHKDFYFKSDVVAPGRAVVVGTNALQFCTGGEIQTVTLPDFPTNTSNAANCFWHHDWVWELPAGWKVTSATGSFTGATNTFQDDGNTVKIQAPAGILFGNYTLNVRSEDAWPFPINTQSTIYTGSPSPPTDISYDFLIDFPATICYDNSDNSGSFILQSPFFGPSPSSYEWDTDAGTFLGGNPSGTSATVTFNNPGSSRYIRVRSVGSCGTSAWYTQNFSLEYNAFGCSGGGGLGGGFGFRSDPGPKIKVFPNPTIDQFEIDFSESDKLLLGVDAIPQETRKSVMLIDNLQRVVYQQEVTGEHLLVPVSGLPHGVYFLRVTDKYGTRTKKVFIDRK